MSSTIKVTPCSLSGFISSFTASINSHNVVFLLKGSENTVSDKDKQGAMSCIFFPPFIYNAIQRPPPYNAKDMPTLRYKGALK